MGGDAHQHPDRTSDHTSDRARADRDRARMSYLARMDEIPGWLHPLDAELLCALSDWQLAHAPPADILEIGVYHGRSAVLLGYLLGAGERLIACDTFLDDGGLPDDNALWNRRFYPGLTRHAFEANYRRHHARPPVLAVLPSTRLPEMVPAGSCRLVHVDGAHDHATVCADAAVARTLLRPGGAAVFDDYCRPHLPGTALAVWQQVLTGGLVPCALTDAKLYGTWDAERAGDYRDALVARAERVPGARVDEHRMLGYSVPRIVPRPAPAAWSDSPPVAGRAG